MSDHFGLLVDRLLTEATLESTIEGQQQLKHMLSLTVDDALKGSSSHKLTFGSGSFPKKVVECRICHDEDDDAKMEVPCSCRGSLKYAHRRCVQRWCNEKGDTVCEICLQQFKPGYTLPPHIFQFRGLPMSLRENWGITQRNNINPMSINRNFRDPEYSSFVPRTTSLVFCGLIAIFFMGFLILCHLIPLIIDGCEDYYFSESMAILLQGSTAALLPLYIVIVAALAMTLNRRQRARRSSFDLDV